MALVEADTRIWGVSRELGSQWAAPGFGQAPPRAEEGKIPRRFHGRRSVYGTALPAGEPRAASTPPLRMAATHRLSSERVRAGFTARQNLRCSHQHAIAARRAGVAPCKWEGTGCQNWRREGGDDNRGFWTALLRLGCFTCLVQGAPVRTAVSEIVGCLGLAKRARAPRREAIAVRAYPGARGLYGPVPGAFWDLGGRDTWPAAARQKSGRWPARAGDAPVQAAGSGVPRAGSPRGRRAGGVGLLAAGL